jgi:hypothetical protein
MIFSFAVLAFFWLYTRGRYRSVRRCTRLFLHFPSMQSPQRTNGVFPCQAYVLESEFTAEAQEYTGSFFQKSPLRVLCGRRRSIRTFVTTTRSEAQNANAKLYFSGSLLPGVEDFFCGDRRFLDSNAGCGGNGVGDGRSD